MFAMPLSVHLLYIRFLKEGKVFTQLHKEVLCIQYTRHATVEFKVACMTDLDNV